MLQFLEDILEEADAEKKGKEIEIKLISRLRKHPPTRSQALGERLWAMTVNGRWRICFRFRNGNAYDVEITDDHQE